MRVLITGGQGFIGRKLATALSQAGTLRGQAISEIVLADIVEGDVPEAAIPHRSVSLDISDRAAVDALFQTPFDVIYHLAAVVSGAAEADFDLGMRVNLIGSINVFDAARAQGNNPVLVYASSCAAHGGNQPDPVPEYVELNPQTSYGTQKVMGELLLNDMSRKGFIDGRGLRLPTVTIRPGKANAAASSFMSSIFRDTMQGTKANCPVLGDYVVWHTSPRILIENLIHAGEIDGQTFGYNRNVNLPGRSDTIDAMIDAMTQITGPEPANRITWEPDAAVQAITSGWRGNVEHAAALALGFVADKSFSDSVRWFLDDDIVV